MSDLAAAALIGAGLTIVSLALIVIWEVWK